MRLPDLALVVTLNHAVREGDEWFGEPDDPVRVQRALDAVASETDPVHGAAVLAFRLARAQPFAEGNKRMALLAAKRVLDRHGVDSVRLIRLMIARWRTC